MRILLSLSKDDLHYFQIKHFHQSFTSTFDHAGREELTSRDNVISNKNGVLNNDEELDNDEDGTYLEDDDGLGYYPDGVKRTLTDEQIAMFRHSEIYSLFRKQQLQDEARDVDESAKPGSSNLGSMPDSASEVVKGLECGPSDDDDDERYIKFLEEEGKQMEADRKQMQAEHKTKKRKFGQVNSSKPHERPPTHRRIARELDDAITSHDILNYDEENAENLDTPKEPSHGCEDYGSKSKDLISEASTTVHTTSATTPRDPSKGRKIWWPTIGKPSEILPCS